MLYKYKSKRGHPMQLSGAHSEKITLKKGQDGLKNTHVLASIIRLVGMGD